MREGLVRLPPGYVADMCEMKPLTLTPTLTLTTTTTTTTTATATATPTPTPTPTTNNGEAGYWRMQNGYLLPARRGGLSKLAERLRDIEKSQVKLKKARVAAFPPRRATNAQAP